MSKHIPAEDLPLQAASHSGSSPSAAHSLEPGTARLGQSPSERDRTSGITDEQIAVRAYEIWLGRGKPQGTQEEDWLEARRQLHETTHSPQTTTTPLVPSR